MAKAYGSGFSKPSPPNYLNWKGNDTVDLIAPVSNVDNLNQSSWVQWSNANRLVVPQNFLLKAWFYPSRISMKLLKLYSVNGSENDFVEVAYQRSDVEDYITIRTNTTQIDKPLGDVLNPQDLCFLWLKHNNGNWDVRFEVLESAPDIIINWNEPSTALYNASTDIPYDDETYGSYIAVPTVETPIENAFNCLIVSNAIFDHMTITSDINEPYSNVHKNEVNANTIFNCNFDNNIICLQNNAPILSQIETFNAAKSKKIVYFNTDAEDIVRNRLQIYSAETDELLYDEVIITYDFAHTIPANTLVNGKKYYARLKTITRTDIESYWSNSVEFYCYTEPTLECNIKEGDVLKDSNLGFITTYNQIEGEKLEWITIDVQDSNGVYIGKSGELHNSDTPPVKVYYNCVAQVEGEYTATINLKTVTGATKQLVIHFTVDIDESKEQYLNVEDNCKGYIEVSAYPKVTGMGELHIYSDVGGYIDYDEEIQHNERLKLVSAIVDPYYWRRSDWARWNGIGVTIPQNFVLSCWFSPSRLGNKLMQLTSLNSSDKIEAFFERGVNTDYIRVITQSGTYLTASFGSHVTINDKCFMWLKHASGSWELRVERLETSLVPILISWSDASEKMGSNAEYNVSTDIPYDYEPYGDFVPESNIMEPLGNALDDIMISNGIFEHLYVDSNVSLPYSTVIPETSTSTTIMTCAFRDDLSCSDISADKVIFYHREVTLPEQPWIKLYTQNLKGGFNDIMFNDLIVKSGIAMEYKAEYYASNKLVDTRTKTVTPHFNRVFISDSTGLTFKFEANIIYSNSNQNVQIGQLIPLGSKYPIVIQNAMTNYRSGNISMTVLGASFEDTHSLDREDIRVQADEILEFLTNKKAKLIKDWNGNIFIFKVVNTPSINYDANYGNGIINIGFDWVEQADYKDLDALRELGFYTGGN